MCFRMSGTFFIANFSEYISSDFCGIFKNADIIKISHILLSSTTFLLKVLLNILRMYRLCRISLVFRKRENKTLLNPFHATVPFLYPQKTWKPRVFRMYRKKKKDQWHEMGWNPTFNVIFEKIYVELKLHNFLEVFNSLCNRKFIPIIQPGKVTSKVNILEWLKLT